MKLNTVEQKVEHFGTTTVQKSFGIKSTAKAFSVLASKLYKNKIASVIREISCNAYDSHVAAGVVDTPFEVHLPTAFEPYFSVRDFGIGMSHDQIESVFTTFFESTKEDSNDYIGALGLGSKSPFSYVDSFIVYAYRDGHCTTYECHIENRVPVISKRAEVLSNAPTGIEISMAVQPNDCWKFAEEARKIFYWFDVRPTIIGDNLSIGDREPRLGTCWSISRDRHDLNAIMGQVCYPLDAEIVELNIRGLTIYFDIGEVDIQAGREELSYDRDTIAAIKARVDIVRNEIDTQYDNLFSDCANIFEAAIKVQEAKNPLYGIITPKFKGTPVSGSVTHALREFGGGSFGGDLSKEKPEDLIVFINDAPYQRGYSTAVTRFNIWRATHGDCKGVTVDAHRGNKDDIIALLGDIPYVLSSSIPLPPRKAKIRRLGNQLETAFRLKREETIDLNEGGYYIVAKNLQALKPDTGDIIKHDDFQKIHRIMLAEIADAHEAIIIPWSRKGELTDDWKCLYSELHVRYADLIKNKEFVRGCRSAREYRYFDIYRPREINFEAMKGILPFLPDGDLADFINALGAARVNSEKYNMWLAYEDIFHNGNKQLNTLTKRWNDVRNSLPLVGDTYRSRNYHNGVTDIVAKELAVYVGIKQDMAKQILAA